MLTTEENELLSRVGPGTKMGTVLRQFWVPALRSARLEAGGAPERVRLLGQDFVAFRASDGRVGFLDEACPHRGVSLSIARNHDCALS
jgi:phthalate 4,5-dioxygenase